jgi:hypothetical protein
MLKIDMLQRGVRSVRLPLSCWILFPLNLIPGLREDPDGSVQFDDSGLKLRPTPRELGRSALFGSVNEVVAAVRLWYGEVSLFSLSFLYFLV